MRISWSIGATTYCYLKCIVYDKLLKPRQSFWITLYLKLTTNCIYSYVSWYFLSFILLFRVCSCVDHNWVLDCPSQHEHSYLHSDRPETTRWIVLTEMYLWILKTKCITIHMNTCNLFYVTNILSCDLFHACILALYLHVSNKSTHNYS